MNYDHAFHAGNFADVVKHVVLARILIHLGRKETAYRVLDTHAGAGLHDLTGPEATRGAEWQAGAGVVHDTRFAPEVETLLAPWRAALAAVNPEGKLRVYPGSPMIACALMRPQDRLLLCEAEPRARDKLADTMKAEPRAKVLAVDAWQALAAFLPPKERRGLVLIDPPFERPGEFDRLAHGLAEAHGRFAGGVLAAWYPIKDVRAVDAFRREVQRIGMPKTLRIEFDLRETRQADRLSGCGMIVVNPPFTLADDLRVLLAGLAPRLALDGRGRIRIGWMVPER